MSPYLWPARFQSAKPVGGDEQNRTVDPLLARQVLSQLSYAPLCQVCCFRVSPPFEDLGRPSKLNSVRLLEILNSTSSVRLGCLSHQLSGSVLHRKEVIQPHLPIRLPCYDFTPVANPTFGSVLHKGQATDFGYYRLPWCDGRCVQGPGTYSPRHADPRLLAIPTSYRRVAAYNLNWDRF